MSKHKEESCKKEEHKNFCILISATHAGSKVKQEITEAGCGCDGHETYCPEDSFTSCSIGRRD